MAASCFRSPPAPDISSFLLLHPRSRMARVQPHRLRFQCSKRRSLPLMLYFLDLGGGRGAPSSFPSSVMWPCRREPCIYGEAALPSTWSNENGYVYEICNKGFQRDQNLKLHRRGHNLPWKLREKSIKEAVRKRVYFGPEESCVHHHPSRALGDLTGIKKNFSGSTGRRSGGVRGAPRGMQSTLTGKPMSRPVEQGSTDATVESSSLDSSSDDPPRRHDQVGLLEKWMVALVVSHCCSKDTHHLIPCSPDTDNGRLHNLQQGPLRANNRKPEANDDNE